MNFTSPNNSFFYLKTIAGLALFLLFPNTINSQNEIQNEIQNKVQKAQDKLQTSIDTFKSNRVTIIGQINLSSAYNILSEQENKLDYNVAINLLAEHRGLRIPFSYRLTNGRSITQFSGPSFKTPSFKAFGMSPTYKGMKLHIGNRSMNLSKYTYNGLRFEGLGFESKEERLFLKFFKGSLKTLSPIDQRYTSSYDLPYKRSAWGSQIGFKNEYTRTTIAAFKAHDLWSNKIAVDSVQLKPKENTALSFDIQTTISSDYFVSLECAVSAITRDASTNRIDIPTHQTFYNMLGLFEKKEASSYHYARRFELGRKLSDSEASLEYEKIDNGYSTLGSVYNINNIEDFKLNYTNTKLQRLLVSSSLGLRKLADDQEGEKDNNFLLSLNLGYKLSNRININSSYSNLRLVQNSYIRSPNSTTIDSLVISQTNNNVNVGVVYTDTTDAPIVVTLLTTLQNSQSILNQSLINTSIRNRVFNLIATKVHNKKLTSTHSIGYSSNTSTNFTTSSWNVNSQIRINLTKNTTYSQAFSYSYVKNLNNVFHRIALNQRLEYMLWDVVSSFVNNTYEFNTNDTKFGLNNIRIELGLNYIIAPFNFFNK